MRRPDLAKGISVPDLGDLIEELHSIYRLLGALDLAIEAADSDVEEDLRELADTIRDRVDGANARLISAWQAAGGR